MALSAILVVGMTVSILTPREAAAQRPCHGVIITLDDKEICIPYYVVIDRSFDPEPPCLCPIEIHINPKILEKMGLSESLINIHQGDKFDNVSVSIPTYGEQFQGLQGNTSMGLTGPQ